MGETGETKSSSIWQVWCVPAAVMGFPWWAPWPRGPEGRWSCPSSQLCLLRSSFFWQFELELKHCWEGAPGAGEQLVRSRLSTFLFAIPPTRAQKSLPRRRPVPRWQPPVAPVPCCGKAAGPGVLMKYEVCTDILSEGARGMETPPALFSHLQTPL